MQVMSADGVEGLVRSTCPYCGVGCGVLARPRADGGAEIKGDPQHPANFGRLCSKGSALGETVSLDGRLLHPQISLAADGVRHVRRQAGWDEALDHVAGKFKAIIAKHGPEAVAFYVSGQLLTEDYYVANKLVKGWLGTANIDTNSRLCMSSAVAGHVRAFGEDVVPVSYEDFESADLVVLVGSNLAWCHPVLYQRLIAAREQRPSMKIVVIDPRRTPTCEIADLHLALRAGSDVALFNGLLTHLFRSGVIDTDFVTRHTRDSREALLAAGGESLAATAEHCGVAPDALRTFYELFAATNKVVTAFSMGVNQSSSGTDKVNAIINCHLLTGRLGAPGMGPFSITGQPNAMGGREVGGLANMLAAHLKIEDATHRALVQEFWQSPAIAQQGGLKAVELFEAIGSGKVKAVWIIATNPVVSLPDADAVRAALARCELVVVSDCVSDTDTAKLAHVLLPAAAWGEKDGTVTNSERRISRQRAFLPLPGEARADWWMLCEFAKRMGWGRGFGYSSAQEIFVEHARLSAYRNGSGAESGAPVPRLFNLEALADLDAAGYDALAPQRWPVLRGEAVETGRRWLLPKPARFVATESRLPGHAPDAAWPLVLNTGRVRDHWHTMTRTGRSPRLAGHTPAPFVSLHADDAKAAGIGDGQFARVETQWGALIARARVTGDVTPGALFVPIHWNDAFASAGRVGALVNPVVDPVSGEPEFKHTPARVRAWPARWQGFLLTRATPDLAGIDWWARASGEQHGRYELAGLELPQDWPAFARRLLDDSKDGDWLEFEDSSRGSYRVALVRKGRLEACLFVSSAPLPLLPSQDWLAALFAKPQLDVRERAALLAGRRAGGADAGPQVCACYGVCRNAIVKAIRDSRLSTPQQIGRQLKAGTNCGSCLPELRALLAEVNSAATS
ncbi:MAG: nitrate reductase [Nevskia sp.]